MEKAVYQIILGVLHIPSLILAEELLQLLSGLLQPLHVRRVDHIDEHVCILKVVPPVRPVE